MTQAVNLQTVIPSIISEGPEREYVFMNSNDVVERQEFFSDVKDALRRARELETSVYDRLRVFVQVEDECHG